MTECAFLAFLSFLVFEISSFVGGTLAFRARRSLDSVTPAELCHLISGRILGFGSGAGLFGLGT